MKKIIVFVMAAMLLVSCGGRGAKQTESGCCADSTEVVVDSTVVAADTLVVE